MIVGFGFGLATFFFGKSQPSCSSSRLSEKCFVMFCDVFSFPSDVYVGSLKLIVSIPGPSILSCDPPARPGHMFYGDMVINISMAILSII